MSERKRKLGAPPAVIVGIMERHLPELVETNLDAGWSIFSARFDSHSYSNLPSNTIYAFFPGAIKHFVQAKIGVFEMYTLITVEPFFRDQL